MPSCASAALNFCVVFEVLVLADVGQPVLELLVGDVVALLLAELEEQHLVDRVDENPAA